MHGGVYGQEGQFPALSWDLSPQEKLNLFGGTSMLGKNSKTSHFAGTQKSNKTDEIKGKCPWFIKCNALRWLRAWQRRQKMGEHMESQDHLFLPGNPLKYPGGGSGPGMLGFGVQTNATPRPWVWNGCQVLG